MLWCVARHDEQKLEVQLLETRSRITISGFELKTPDAEIEARLGRVPKSEAISGRSSSPGRFTCRSP